MRIGIFPVGGGDHVCTYEAEAPQQKEYGGPWGSPALFKHRAIPFTDAELKAQATAAAEAQARATFEANEKKKNWLASDAKKAFDAAQK